MPLFAFVLFDFLSYFLELHRGTGHDLDPIYVLAEVEEQYFF